MRLEESGEGEKPALKETDSAGNEHKTENQEERTVEHISSESGMKEEKNVEAHAERQDLALVGPEASDKPVKFKPKSKDNDVEVTDLVGPCGKSLEGTPWGSRLERNTEQLSAVVGGEALAEGKKDNGMQRPSESMASSTAYQPPGRSEVKTVKEEIKQEFGFYELVKPSKRREKVEKPLMGAWAARQAKREQKIRLEESGEGEKPALKETDSAGNEHKTENQEEGTVEHISCESGMKEEKNVEAHAERQDLALVGPEASDKPVKFKPKSKDNDVEVTDLVGPCGKSLEGTPWGSRLERNTEQLSAVVGGEALAEGKKDNGMQRPSESMASSTAYQPPGRSEVKTVKEEIKQEFGFYELVKPSKRREKVEKPLMGAWAARQAKREQKMRLEESGEGEKPALKETDSAGNEHKTENQEERTVEHISCESGMKEEKNVEAHAERQDLALVGPEASDREQDPDKETTEKVLETEKILSGKDNIPVIPQVFVEHIPPIIKRDADRVRGTCSFEGSFEGDSTHLFYNVLLIGKGEQWYNHYHYKKWWWKSKLSFCF